MNRSPRSGKNINNMKSVGNLGIILKNEGLGEVGSIDWIRSVGENSLRMVFVCVCEEMVPFLP